jgi:hypothetical protein
MRSARLGRPWSLAAMCVHAGRAQEAQARRAAQASAERAGRAIARRRHRVRRPAVLAERPVVSELSIRPLRRRRQAPPPVAADRRGGRGTVYVQVTVSSLSTHRPVMAVSLGWVRTGRTRDRELAVGRDADGGQLPGEVSAHDRHGATLLRSAHSSGEASLTMTAPSRRRPTTGARPRHPRRANRACPRRRRRWPTARCSRSPARTTSAARKTLRRAARRLPAPGPGHPDGGRHPGGGAAGGHDPHDELPGRRRGLLRGRADGDRLRLHVRPLPGRIARREPPARPCRPGRRCAGPARPAMRPLPTWTSRSGSAAGRPPAGYPINPLPYLEAWEG